LPDANMKGMARAKPRVPPAKPWEFMGEVVGLRIQAKRKQLGLGLAELGRRTGVNKGQLSLIEHGEQPFVSTQVMGRIARQLYTSLDELLGLDAEPLTTVDGTDDTRHRSTSRL